MSLKMKSVFVPLVGLSLLKSCSTQRSAATSIAFNTTSAQASVERHLNTALLDGFLSFLGLEAQLSTASRQNPSTAAMNGTSPSKCESPVAFRLKPITDQYSSIG